jgi:hypothetical protein
MTEPDTVGNDTRPLTPDMIRAAGALLAVAFRDDPCFGVLLGGTTPRSGVDAADGVDAQAA